MKAELNCMRWILRYIVVWFAAWCGMRGAMDESVVDWFVEDADTPVLLLEGYGKQQLWLFTTMVLVIVITVGFAIVAVIFQVKDERNPKNKEIVGKWAAYDCRPVFLIVVLAAFVWIPIAMLKDLTLIERYAQMQKDIAAIEEGRLRSDVVFVSPDFSTVDFVPYGGNKTYADTAVCYKVSGVNESREHLPAWEKIYVPDILNFTMDMEYAFNEWKSISWNKEHVTLYRITYTPNMHFVVSIEVESRGK